MGDILSLVFRWLHIVPAIVMVGGVIFLRCCVTKTGEPSFLDVRDDVRKRWAKLVMISTLLLLVSGLYNAATKAMGYDLSPDGNQTYNILLLLKIILALAVFFFVARLSGRSDKAKQFRQRESQWLDLLIAMMLAIVLIAGYMKVSSAGFEEKVRDEQTQVEQEVLATSSNAVMD
jgi:uncharacterized membrane protein